jgi:Flp pilus assembly protein TadD
MKPSIESVRSLYRAGDLRRAERDARALLAVNPDHAELIYLLGCLRRDGGHVNDAIELFERAVGLAPMRPELLEALSAALLKRGDLDGAEREAMLAQRCGPDRARPVILLGLAAMERGDLETAMVHFSGAATMEMPNLDAMVNMASALHRAGDWASAEKWSRSALRIAPGHTGAWLNLGLALKAQRRLEEAKGAFRSAGSDPRARFNLGYTLMLEGTIAEGLPLLEMRKSLLGIGRGLSKPEWTGKAHSKQTLLVVHEQGMGDTLLMCRFWPALRERFAHVVAFVQPPLARLLAVAFPEVEVVTTLEGIHYGHWCATMSLPWLLGVDSVERIPCEPWIRLPESAPADSSPLGGAADGRDASLRVGLNWAGNPKFAFDAVRSTHLSSISVLLQAAGVEWVSLHKGHLEEEAEAAGLPQPLREASDFLDTARVIRDLDLVVSTETAIPNLSAAMGVPTCILASPDWDWRWAHWYPNVTVCAQERTGEWMPACVRTLEVIRDTMVRRQAQEVRAA